MSSKLRVAFLGARHPHIFPRLALCLQNPDVDITGVYDSDPKLSEAVARNYNIPIASTVDELFQGSSCDLVIIEGHDPENPGCVRQALGRARMLLIEKPGAPNLVEMEAMVKEIEQAGIHAQLGYMYNYSPVIGKVKTILASGVLGHLTLARFHAGAPVGGAVEIWQSLPEDMGGVLFTDGCHMLALIVCLIGQPYAVTGRLLKISDGPKVIADIYKNNTLSGLGAQTQMRLGQQLYEDAGAAILEYQNMLATFDVTGWEAHNWVEAWSIELFGTDGTLQVSLVPPSFRLWVRRPHENYDKGWHTWQGVDTAAGSGASLVVDENYFNEMADILGRLRSNAAPDYTSLRQALAVVKISDAIYRSSSASTSSRFNL